MRILGIDPGTATVGFGVIDVDPAFRYRTVHYGIIQTPSAMPIPERLRMIHQDMAELLDTFKPDVLSIEQLFAFRNVTTVISVSQARGVILLAGQEGGCTFAEYPPMVIKKTITGYGRASKLEVQERVRDLLELELIPRPDDAADALAIAICYAQHLEGGI